MSWLKKKLMDHFILGFLKMILIALKSAIDLIYSERVLISPDP